MNNATIEKPVLKESYVSAISCSQDDIEMMKRRQSRAKELGIRLFVLDGESNDQELQELEDFIVDNYIDYDLDVPDDVKKKYLELKEQLASAKTVRSKNK